VIVRGWMRDPRQRVRLQSAVVESVEVSGELPPETGYTDPLVTVTVRDGDGRFLEMTFGSG
jgi:hypothetical protein